MSWQRATVGITCVITVTCAWCGAASLADEPPASAPASPPAAGERTGGPLDDLAQEHSLLWQQAVRAYRDVDGQARKATLANDYVAARKLAQEAQYIIERNRRYSPSPEEYEARRDEARGLANYVETEERAWNEEQALKKQQELVRREKERMQSIEESKRRKIELLKNQADELAKERKYEQAIQILKEVLAIDPTDDQAQWKKTMLEDVASARGMRETISQAERETVGVLRETEESGIPWHQDITYPRNWLEISAKRKGAEAETDDPRTQEIRRRLDETIRDVNFDALTFEQVVSYLTDLTGLNILVNWSALELNGIDRDKEVTLKLKDVSLKKLLSEILQQVGGGEIELGYDIDEGVITISTKEDLARRTVTRTYNVEDLLVGRQEIFGRQINLDNIGQQQGGGGGGGGGFGGGGGGGGAGGGGIFGGGGGVGGGGGQQGPIEETPTIDEVMELIRDTIDPESWRDAGGNIGSIRNLANQLIVTQTSTAHQQLRDLLRQLRQARAIQVAIEARFISITRNYLEQIGVDLDIVLNNGNAGFDRAGFQSTPLRDPATGTLVLVPREFSRLGFTPGTPSGLGLTNSIQGFPQPFGQAGLVPPAQNFGPHSSRFTPIPIQNNTLSLVEPIATNIPGSLGGSEVQPAVSMFGSFLDNLQVDFLLQATQADVRSHDLDAPRLVLKNGDRALFSSFIEQDYVASLTPVLGDNVGLFAPFIARALTGRQLNVKAVVSADRRYVDMNINTFTRVSGDPVPFQFTTGSLTGGAGFVQLIRQTTNTLQTQVSVPDGGTLLIGGLKQAAERERDAGVPILSRIPVLKRAFSNTSLVKDDSVLLILIKPKIIIQDEAEEEAFPTLSRRD